MGNLCAPFKLWGWFGLRIRKAGTLALPCRSFWWMWECCPSDTTGVWENILNRRYIGTSRKPSQSIKHHHRLKKNVPFYLAFLGVSKPSRRKTERKTNGKTKETEHPPEKGEGKMFPTPRKYIENGENQENQKAFCFSFVCMNTLSFPGEESSLQIVFADWFCWLDAASFYSIRE